MENLKCILCLGCPIGGRCEEAQATDSELCWKNLLPRMGVTEEKFFAEISMQNCIFILKDLRSDDDFFNEERDLLNTCLLGTARARAAYYLDLLRFIARNTSALDELNQLSAKSSEEITRNMTNFYEHKKS